QAARSGRIFHHGEERLSGSRMSSRKLVMGAFTRQQRPRASLSGAVECGTIFVFAVAVTVVAIPRRALGKFHAQKFVDDLNRVQYSGIIRRAQTEAYQSQGIWADDFHRPHTRRSQGTILDGNE